MQHGQQLSQRLIAYVTVNRFGNYVPMLATTRDVGLDQPDMLLVPEGAMSPFIQLDYALRAIECAAPAGTEIFKMPIQPNETGLTWLSELQIASGMPSCFDKVKPTRTRKRKSK